MRSLAPVSSLFKPCVNEQLIFGSMNSVKSIPCKRLSLSWFYIRSFIISAKCNIVINKYLVRKHKN